MKVLLFVAAILPIVCFANSSFLSEGVGFSCYQEYDDALANARSSADNNAQRLCNNEKAWRLSEFKHLQSTSYCQVRVQAKYLCQ